MAALGGRRRGHGSRSAIDQREPPITAVRGGGVTVAAMTPRRPAISLDRSAAVTRRKRGQEEGKRFFQRKESGKAYGMNPLVNRTLAFPPGPDERRILSRKWTTWSAGSVEFRPLFTRRQRRAAAALRLRRN